MAGVRELCDFTPLCVLLEPLVPVSAETEGKKAEINRVFEDTQFVLLTLCKSPGHRDREGRAGGSRNCLGMRDLGAERRRWWVCHGQQQGAAHQQQGQKGGEDLGRQR